MAVLVSGCTTGSLPVVEPESASTVGVVAAIRLSPQLHDINAGASRGYVLLVDATGRARALKTGPMEAGHLTWSRNGVSFGDTNDEYVLGAVGLSKISRGSEEAYETSRFVSPDGDGFIAVYNVGFGDGEYLARVTTGDGATSRSWDAKGMFESVSQCGGLVVGITDIKATSPRYDGSGVRSDVLVQLYPEPASKKSAVRATLPLPGGSFTTDSVDAPCHQGTVFTLAFQYDQPDERGAGWPVVRAWNTTTGAHTVIPLVTEQGAPIDVALGDMLERPGRIVGGRYLWVTLAGRVLSTDLRTGVTVPAFQISLSSPEMGESQFVFTDTSVYVLDVGQNLRAALDLSRYDLATGKRTKALSIPGTGAVHHGLNMVIRDLALNPDWVKTEPPSAPESGRTPAVRR